ncbi:hypothetical protein MVEG_09184 [Podila verticillata NRRL 6337]|nr:hypothetical protein MVEG_09184 [Podila verticillata NRRL 6337]
MFDGSFKSKRTINLGGNKQQIDKQKLLRQAQEERRIREAERLRLKSAERIQAWYRGRIVAAKTREALRAAWDQEIADCAVQLLNGNTATIEQLASRVQTLVSRFLLFFRPAIDHFRLIKLSGLLLSRQSNAQGLAAIVPFHLTANSKAWTSKLLRFSASLLQHLGEHSGWTDEESDPLLKLVEALTLADTFHPVKDSAGSVAFARQFCQALLRSDVFSRIAQFLQDYSVEDRNSPSVARALLLSIRVCRVLDQTCDYHAAIDNFTIHILTVPALPNRMSIEMLSTFTSRLPLDAILQYMSSRLCASIAVLPSTEVLPLVANVIAFSYQRVAKMTAVVSAAYLQVLTILLGLIPIDSLEKKKRRLVDEDEDMEDADWKPEDLTASSPRPSEGLDQRILKWLSLAYDSNHLSDILGSLKPTNGSPDVLTPESIGQITQLLLNLITVFPSHKISILSNLMYFRFGSKTKHALGSTQDSQPTSLGGKFLGISIIKIFLDAFMSTSLHHQLLKYVQQDSSSSVQLVLDPAHANSWSLLAFISELYCQILATMGDDEFYDEARNPISISNVVSLSAVVRDVAFLLWWNDNALNMEANIGGSRNLRVGYLREIVTELTRQLHARDSRKRFCPKDHWLLSMPLNMQSFQQAVILDAESLSREEENEDRDDMRPNAEDTSSRTQRSINRRQGSSQLARLSPRLGVLNNIPFIIRFEDRVAIFRSFVESDRQRSLGMSNFHPMAVGHARVRRGSIFEDGYQQLNHLGRKLKGRIAIEFIDQHGISEAGIDGGGVFKEFLTSLVHQAFDTNYGLFLNTSDQLLFPNPHAFAREATQLKHYEFLGRILGKALYEGILIDAAFAGFFLGKCLGQVNYLDDLPSLDPELYRGLMFLKNYEGDVEDLSLFFTVDDEEMGTKITRELVPNGSNIAVTRQNRIRYIYMTAHYRLNTQINRQCKAFFRGLSDLIDPKWLWMFNEQELQVMLGGAQIEISLEDLKKNVVYSNFEVGDPTIQFFWSVVQEMAEEDRRLLIKFITSCARPPLLGFAELNPKLCIRHAGVEESRLPTSSTCMNLLKLPAFSTRQRLKEKLMYAIHSEAGFDLS